MHKLHDPLRCLLLGLLIGLAGCGMTEQSLPGAAAGSPRAGTPSADPAPAPGAEPTPRAFARSCHWLVNSDPDLVNIAYPDTAAQYWNAIVPIPPGGELRIRGEFPHARYMSYNVYNATLSSFEGIADVELLPDEGSQNPFLPGADRTASARRYTLRVVANPAPEDPAEREPNTLYAAFPPLPQTAFANLIYRIYINDRGTSLAGNVDLPSFHYVLPGGVEIPIADACALLEQTRLGLGVNELLANADLSALPLDSQAYEPLRWTRFVSAPISLTGMAEGYATPLAGQLPVWAPVQAALFATGLEGGFLSNRDNAYVSATVSQSLGEIAVIAARAPLVPPTFENQAVMAPAQLRYWSLCTNDAPSQRFWDCLYDEQLPQDGNGDYLLVISRPDRRPANARPECGVAWLNWGPMPSSLLILRHMLPSASFPHAVQNVPPMSGSERQVMADYYPHGGHTSVADFEGLSLDPQGGPETCRVRAEGLRARLRAGPS